MYQTVNSALYTDVYRTNVNWNKAASLVLSEEKAATRRTLTEIVDATGLSESSVKRYLAGTRAPSLEDFAAIARALGRDPLALFAAVEARVEGDQ